MNTGFIKTNRISFGVWKQTDFVEAKSLWGDPVVTRLISASRQLSDEEVIEKLNREIKNYKEFHVQYWPFYSKEDQEFIGCCGLKPYDLKNNVYEIGCHLRKKFWKKGYAFEAAKEIIDYAFYQLNIEELFAGHNPKNKASKRLLKKLDFCYTHNEFYKETGLNHPSYKLTKK